ncbi:MAG: tripartite tricarboxylate transporter TctB family protein [Betaproteobacteria bacterium]|nr:tripartite tricarboxylate transporter TctB family protein [Betaproteobacteria bacterium]
MGKVANNADFWAGVMFILFGAAAVYMSRDYPMGSAMRMGPGYFPTYLGILMMLFGLGIGAKGLLKGSDAIGPWAFRPIVVLSLGVIVFGLLIERVGFVPSLVALIVITTFAGRDIKWLELLIVTIALVAGAVAVFIYGIGLPYQLFWWY